MYNLRNNRPESVIRKMKFDLLSQSHHRRVVIVGSGEAGFLALNKATRLPFIKPEDIGLISNEPIHRTRFGSLLYSMNYYEKLDFENPLIGSHRDTRLMFEDILAVEPKASRLHFHNQKFIDYDYLVLACGREADRQRLGSLIDYSEQTFNDIYNADSIVGYKKLRTRYSSLHGSMRFNILLMRDNDQVENCVNFALLMRKKFKKADINLICENNWLIEQPAANGSLVSLLERSGVNIISQSKVSIQKVEHGISIKINDEMEIGNEFVFFAPTKTIPNFLSNNLQLLPEAFDPLLLSNVNYPEIFAAGSYLFPNSGLRAKTLQTDCLTANMSVGLYRDRSKKAPDLVNYNPEDKMYLFKDFTRIMTLDKETGELSSGFIEQKKAAWRFLNWDMLAYFYLQKRGFAHKRLFK